MTDPLPLLTNGAAPESQPPRIEANLERRTSLDDTIEHFIGEFGWKQMCKATLVAFAWFFDAQQKFISVFTDAEPKWSCINTNQSCSSDLCHLPAAAWTWDSPPNTSIISEWSLQCAASVIKGLPASSFLFGSLIGGFALATLADSWLGRKNLLVLSSLVMSITGVLTAFSTNIWMYTALRFVGGFSRAGVGTCALVLSTELVGKKWREKIGILGFIFFGLGFLSIPAIAYFARDSSWRVVYLWTCVPSFFYSLSVHFLVRESPRWLFVMGRREEFAETRLGGMTAATLQETNIFSAVKILLERGWSCRRMLSMMVVAFGTQMAYYGLTLALGNLPLNLYVSVTLNAVSEFPAALFIFFVIGKLSRKRWTMGLCMVSGICSVSCVFVRRQEMQMALEMVSFFAACTATDLILIYLLELFPTCVRNSAVSMVRQATLLGGALSPVLAAAGRKHGVLSYGVFGVTIFVCSLFVLCLPETKGRTLCDTIEEEERWDAAVKVNGV